MNRRTLLQGSLLGFVGMGLAACAVPGATTSVTPTTGGNGISFASVQAEVAQIQKGIDASAAVFLASPTATPQQKVDATQAKEIIDAAALAVESPITTTTTPAALVSTFMSNAQAIMPLLAPVLSLNPMTGAAITLGFAVLQAFLVNGPLPAGVVLPAAAVKGKALAPVPVPLPTRTL